MCTCQRVCQKAWHCARCSFGGPCRRNTLSTAKGHWGRGPGVLKVRRACSSAIMKWLGVLRCTGTTMAGLLTQHTVCWTRAASPAGQSGEQQWLCCAADRHGQHVRDNAMHATFPIARCIRTLHTNTPTLCEALCCHVPAIRTSAGARSLCYHNLQP